MCSVKLVEQELWQREEKGLIGILPVRDSAETATVAPSLSQGDHQCSEDCILSVFVFEYCEMISSIAGLGTDSVERNSKSQVGVSDAHKHESKNAQEVIHWHNRYGCLEGVPLMRQIYVIGRSTLISSVLILPLIYLIHIGELQLELYIYQEEWRSRAGGSPT